MVKLSLCVIVGSNESLELETLLKSVQGPLFDEIIVTTTQTDAKVKEVANRYADKVPHFEWVHDFSAARNFCFDQASGNFIMWLDADDEVSAKAYAQLMEIKETLPNYDYVLLSYNYAQNPDGSPIVLLPRERIVRNEKYFRWVDPIHEFLPTFSNQAKLERYDIIIDHRRKRAYDGTRNLTILRKIYESGKASPRNKFYFAKDLFDNKGVDESLGIFEDYLKNESDFYQNKVVACLKLAEHYKGKKDTVAQKGYLQQALLHSQEYAEPYHDLAELAEAEGDKPRAIALFEQALSKNPAGLFGAKLYFYKRSPLDALTRLYSQVGDNAKALECAKKFLEAWPDDKNYLFNVKFLSEKLNAPVPTQPRVMVPIEKIRMGWFLDFILPEDPSQRIRALNVFEEMKSREYKVSLHTNYMHLTDLDVAIFSSFTEQDQALIKALKEKKVKVIVDINEAVQEYPLVMGILQDADGVVCCSNKLRELTKSLCKRSVVIEDAFEADDGEAYNHFLPETDGKLKALFMGMGGNSFLVTDYLRDVIEGAGYQLEVCTEWDNATKKWDLETWREVMKDSHVVLCPQRVDVQPAKSNIKAAQAMSFGIPVVASPLPAYQDFIQDRSNGYLCSTKEDWSKALIELKDLRKRIQIGLNGKDTAQAFSIRSITDKWAYALSDLMTKVVVPETPRVVPQENVKQPIPIIIPVYNGVEYLKACVTSIHMNTTHSYHLILSDAGSDAATWEYLNSLRGITVLGKPGQRRNFSQAVNAGVRAAGNCKYFAILNSDVIVSKGWLTNLAYRMDNQDRLAVCGVLSNCDRGWLNGVPGRPIYDMQLSSGMELVPAMKYEAVMPHLDELNAFMEKSNSNLKGQYTPQSWVAYYATIIAKSAWDEVGELDEEFQNGCEDLDHCHRIRTMGYEIGQAVDSYVFHFGGISRAAYEGEGHEEYAKEDVYNHQLLKKKWEKKRVVIYTGYAWEKWNRESVDKGMAGSETWASELGASFAKKGFDVTIFNDCPVDGEVDQYGVTYRDHNKMGEWIKYKLVDYMILSRTCEPMRNLHLHSPNIYVMVHDVFLSSDRQYDTRSWAVKKFACLSDWHVDFFSEHHSVGKDKIMLTANGVREELYKDRGTITKKNMAVYSSSADRGLLQLLTMLPAIREQVPDFELVVTYGLFNWLSAAKQRNNPQELEHIAAIQKGLNQPGVRDLGRVSKTELAQLQMQAKVWLYPTWFSETFCITLIENGFAGNVAITSPYAGIVTTGGEAPLYIQGPKDVPVSKWPSNEVYREEFIKQTVKVLTDDSYREEHAQKMLDNAKKYTWDAAADGWLKEWGL
jgi:glycosyltransferase involved in cell wall biosynthesis